jgi:Ca2+-binding EF-hand superfamily protein
MYIQNKIFAEDEKPKKKLTHKEEYNMVEIKNKEKIYFENVFRDLCALEKEESSDNNTKEKKYQRIKGKMKIYNAKKTKPIIPLKDKNNSPKKNKIMEEPKKQVQPPIPIKKYNEDINLDTDSLSEDSSEEKEKEKPIENCLDLYKDPEKEEEKLKRDRFGKKALRKMLKKLTGKFNKKDIELMIWEVDTNLNGYISYDEYERMYKNCVIDKKEREPKRLYNLVQFLMFDKEHKGYITEEDTLEILCIRNNNGLDNAINDIFAIEIKDEKGNVKRTKKKKDIINYEEFQERMHSLSLRQRAILMNQKKIFCDKVKEEAMQNAKLKFDS